MIGGGPLVEAAANLGVLVLVFAASFLMRLLPQDEEEAATRDPKVS